MRSLLALSALVFCASHAGAASLFGTNLVVNGDAEADVGSPSGAQIGPVTGFARTGSFTVIAYGPSFGFPSATSPGPADRGLNLFGGGPSSPLSTGVQTFDLQTIASQVDAGAVSFALSAWLGGFASQRDNAALGVTFLDGLGGALGTASIGPVTAADRGNVTGLLLRDTAGAVPVGTRSARLTLTLTRQDGSYDDGYADNLSFVLTSAVPEPAPAALLAAGLAVLGWRARRRG